jgi:spore maturation protein SpmA
VLNIIWTAFILIAFAAATVQALLGNPGIFRELVVGMMDTARLAFEIALGLTGIMCLWLGIMKIGERGGAVDLLARGFRPLFRRLFPSIPPDSPAAGSIVMNMAANMLGLDNAATPLGLKAMKEMQELNPEKERASDDQILFLVINTSSVTLIPVTIFAYRAQLGATDPTDVFIPILLATYCSTLAGLLVCGLVQKIRLHDPVVLAYLGGMTLLMAGLVMYLGSLDREALEAQSSTLANVTILSVVIGFLLLGVRRRLPLYEVFVDGAKEGFKVAVMIIPYLVAMLVALSLLRTSGALEYALSGIRWLVESVGADTRFVDGLPTALMKPLSGSGARGAMLDAMNEFGPDSFVGRLVSVLQGSTETTFYILAVYFGSVGIRRTRHAVACGLAADFVGIIAAITIAYLFFG